MVVVNSVKVAEDLLDLQGANFSDRPVLPMAGELVGYNNGLALCHYGDRTRKERKLFHQLVGTPAAIRQLVPLLSTEIHKLLRNIVLNPGGLSEEIERFVGCFGRRSVIIDFVETEQRRRLSSESHMDTTCRMGQSQIHT